MESFTGPEIAALIGQDRIIACSPQFSHMLQDDLNAFRSSRSSYDYWFQGVSLSSSSPSSQNHHIIITLSSMIINHYSYCRHHHYHHPPPLLSPINSLDHHETDYLPVGLLDYRGVFR